MDSSNQTTIFDKFKQWKAVCSKSLPDCELTLLDMCTLPCWTSGLIKQASPKSLVTQLTEKPNSYTQIQHCLGIKAIKDGMENAVQEMVTISHGKGRKDLGKSVVFTRRANKMAMKGDLVQALDLYNKSILSAPFAEDVEEIDKKIRLSKLLHARSSILKTMERWPAAFADACAAVKYYPDDLLGNLDLKLAVMKNYLELSVKTGENLEMDSASKSDNDKLKGDKSYANDEKEKVSTDKKTKKGEKSFLVQLIGPSHRNSHCTHCLKPLADRPFPCRGCVYLKFCSFECSEDAWKTYHSKECPHMAALLAIPMGHLALRAFFTVGVDKALDTYCRLFKGKEKIDTKEMKKCGYNFEDILALYGSDCTDPDRFMLEVIGCGAFMGIFARSIGLITEDRVLDFAALTSKFIKIIFEYSLPINNDIYTSRGGIGHFCENNENFEIAMCLYCEPSIIDRICAARSQLFIDSKILDTTRETIHSEKLPLQDSPMDDNGNGSDDTDKTT